MPPPATSTPAQSRTSTSRTTGRRHGQQIPYLAEHRQRVEHHGQQRRKRRRIRLHREHGKSDRRFNARFIYVRTAAGVAGTINGGAGTNTSNYAALTTANVTVNLTTGVASGTGGISNFQNASAGPAMTISPERRRQHSRRQRRQRQALGTDGRDILIGGIGGDLLDGGNDDDILIARTRTKRTYRAATANCAKKNGPAPT